MGDDRAPGGGNGDAMGISPLVAERVSKFVQVVVEMVSKFDRVEVGIPMGILLLVEERVLEFDQVRVVIPMGTPLLVEEKEMEFDQAVVVIPKGISQLAVVVEKKRVEELKAATNGVDLGELVNVEWDEKGCQREWWEKAIEH